LDEIESWTKDSDKSPVYWLNGLAGTGKSTIAQTTAERLFADGRLGASFFCSRDFKDRSDLHLIFPTLSFQLAYRYPDFRSVLVSLLQSDLDIGYESLHNQMQSLIVAPLKEKGISTVIVIDALDECTDNEPQSAILSVMGRLVKEIPKVKFFITGRPEPRIRSGFRLRLLRPLTEIFVLHAVEHTIINADIRRFLETRLSDLAQEFDLNKWPSEEHMDLLCRRAAGLFVYAVTTVKFLDHKLYLPTQRLDVIVNLPESTIHEGQTEFKSNTTLDSLYTSILQMALDFGGDDPEADSKVRSIIGTVILAVNPLPPSAVAELIGLKAEVVMRILTLVQSLLVLNEDPDQPVKPFHKSFPDYITDPSRCLSKRFHISPDTLQHHLALNCLNLMNSSLEQNLLSLPDYALNTEVKDLEERVKNHISPALEYACKSWYNHLPGTRENIYILDALSGFLEDNFLPWLEVLSVLGAARYAVVALEKLIQWLPKVCLDLFETLHITNNPNQVTGGQQLLNTAADYFQFVTKFFEIIKLSAPHIYHSALELSPQSSIVREQYHFKFFQDHGPRVIYGVPSSWKPAIVNCSYGSYTWSPCGQFIAAQTPTSVEIRDTLTLDKHSTLQPTIPIPKDLKPINHSPNALAYSPDGHSLAGCFGTVATIWDIQTGGVIKEIECGAVDASPKSFVWSLDGTAISAIFPAAVGNWIVVTCDIASVEVSIHIIPSPYEPCLCQHGNSIRMMAISENRTTISTFEIWPTNSVSPIKSYAVNSNVGDDPPPIIHQDGFLSWSSHDGTTYIYNIQDKRTMLCKRGFFTTNCFSPGGDLLATSSRHAVHIWRLQSQDYHRWKEIPLWEALGDTPRGLKFSPTSSSLLISRDGYLEVQPLGGSITHTPEEKKEILIEFSTNGTYLAIAFRGDLTIMITNLYNSHSQFIVINFTIRRLVLAGNILFVGGSSWNLAAWRLTAEGTVYGASGIRRVDCSNSLWIKAGMGSNPSFWAGGQIGVIRSSNKIVCYDIETGEEVTKSVIYSIPSLSPSSWGRFYHDSKGMDFSTWPSFSCYNLIEHSGHPSQDNLPASTPWYQEGWLMYPEGEYQHRLWLPTHWRTEWEEAHWLNEIKMLRFTTASGKVVIKF